MTRTAAALLVLAVALACAGVGAAADEDTARASHPAPPPAGLAAAAAGPCPARAPGEADLAIVLWEQRTRTSDEVARAQSEVQLTPEAFAGVVGAPVLQRRPLTRALLQEVMSRAGPLYGEVKKRCARPRPFEADARVAPSVPREDMGPSFPSGHATQGRLVARVLAELWPARRAELLARGRQIGFDRVLLGVHFPTDVEAGQRVADALADAWLAEPDFRARVDAARAAEWPAGGEG